jgi:hypothetical protein
VSQRGGVEHLAEEMRHPELAALLLVVDQPHAGGVALSFLGQCLEQRAKERVEGGPLAHQLEHVLRDLGLDVRQALGSASLGGFMEQRGP